MSRIWCVNAVSAAVWCLLDGFRTPEEIGRELARCFGIDVATATRDAWATLEQFRDSGLLAGSGPPAAATDPTVSARIPPPGPEQPPVSAWAVTQTLQVAGCTATCCFADSGLGQAFRHAARHLENAAGTPRVQLAVTVHPNHPSRRDVYLDGTRRAAGVARGEVLPLVFGYLFLRALDTLQDQLLLHAGVVTRDGRALLLPGVAGSGKSTLVAALLTRGWDYYSDELAVIDRQRSLVTPFPLPLGIKTGSFAPLQPFYPQLTGAAVSDRADGKRVHFLAPPEGSGHAPATARVAHIVVPRLVPAATPRLTPLAKPEALARLAATGSSDRELTADDVAALVALVEGAECWEMEYWELSSALPMFAEVVGAD